MDRSVEAISTSLGVSYACVTSVVCRYDPLLLMEQSGKKRYGFNRVIREGEHCVDGLWDLTRKFVTERGLSPTFLDSWREVSGTYSAPSSLVDVGLS